ncbi:helix-turn-helix domain-containing protein [Streptomyces sp. SID625]|nr:helix-turn-helix domain-containing protein [Streptomyces sp. SID625]
MRAWFDTEGVPPADRLAALDELFLGSDHPMGVRSPDAAGFRASIRAVDLAAVNVVDMAVSSSEVLRTARMVRQADPGLLCVVMGTTGRLVLHQGGREAVLGASDLALYDSSRPFGLRIGADGEQATLIRAHIPTALLGKSAGKLGELTARPLSGRGGFAGLLGHFLTGLSDGCAVHGPNDLARLAVIAEDLLRALVAHHLDADAGLLEEPRQGGLLPRVEAFVQRNLHDPELSPRVIADALHLSVGYLHRLFSDRETTVAAWVRQLRLERARRDLRDADLRDVPVHQIAERWGFKDHSTFTRSFRAAYGMPPRDYRHGLPTAAS